MYHLVADLEQQDKAQATLQLERLLQEGNLASASEDEIVRYIEEHQQQLDELPTELLMQLADKLRRQRSEHYPSPSQHHNDSQDSPDSPMKPSAQMSPNITSAV